MLAVEVRFASQDQYDTGTLW
ncbi:MAG: hypothetical protein QOE04_4296, partial [Mycobacterium sp.]|nr:hypothetical protein [Mycobacterium sp.]